MVFFMLPPLDLNLLLNLFKYKGFCDILFLKYIRNQTNDENNSIFNLILLLQKRVIILAYLR